MTIVLRSEKGSALTHSEMDANFTVLRGVENSYPNPTLTWATATSSGATDYGSGGFFANSSSPQIFRFADRVFIAEAANNFAGHQVPDPGTSWPTNAANGIEWISANSALVVHTSESVAGGKYSGGFLSKLETGMNATTAIAVAGATVLNKAGASGWAGYFDLNHKLGTVGFGIEIAAKNQNADVTGDSYATSTGGGTFGLHINTGDNAFGGTADYNTTAAINIAGGNGGNTTKHYMGIRVASGALAVDGGGFGVVMSMAQKHMLEWMVSAGNRGAEIRSDNATTGANTDLVFEANGLSLYGTNDKRVFRATHTASGVNNLKIYNQATTFFPGIQAEGDDTTIGIYYVSKGTIGHRFCSNASEGAIHAIIGGTVTSPVNYWRMYGSTTGNGVLMTVDGSDTNNAIVFQSKGTGQVQLRSGDDTTKFAVNNTGIAFYGGTPAAKPTISGSRGANAALADLLTELATLGLITDSTSA